MNKLFYRLIILQFALWLGLNNWPCCAEETHFQVGFGKHDITPTEPIRLSGYASRTTVFKSVVDSLSARAMVFQPTDNTGKTIANPKVLITLDAIAVTSEMTARVAKWLQEKYSLSRQDFVISVSHAHTAPHVANGLFNLYSTPLSDEETAAIGRYTDFSFEGIQAAVSMAMSNMKPATLSFGDGTATFAKNRRGIRGTVRPGVTEADLAPVDHRVRILQATDSQGKLLGLSYIYACHCTSISPDINQVSGDWAGMSASRLEQLYPGIVALPVIGCGADSNPDPRGTYELSQKHAAELVTSIQSAIEKPFEAIQHMPQAYFGYAGLAPEIPSRQEVEQTLQSPDYNRRRWAEIMIETWDRKGRLPESYPAPLHVWRFGDQLDWVFMGGEVVLDYQLRMQREMPAKNVWVAAYCDDVFAYVASERVRDEGGYEVDSSMIYYARPGRWQSGTEDLIFKRLKEITAELPSEDHAMTPSESHDSIRVPDGFAIDLMAAEPMVMDPINIAIGPDGRVWVVEMGDYPLGSPTGGRIRWLRDSNGDGQLDESVVFLDKLNFPTGVQPWKDGVLVLQAPELFFARDTDGDGVADERKTLIRGFAESNQQHRASGFEWGLDGWLHMGSGMSTRELEVVSTGQTIVVNSSDVRWHPTENRLEKCTGETQFMRTRDEWGHWFGNSNSYPMFHFIIDDKYMQHRHLSAEPIQHLLHPAVAPPVFPRSRTVDRFNDLHARNRFTSACSSIICRVEGLGEHMRGASLICEPVHNLVGRYQVEEQGVSFQGSRFQEDTEFDFVAASDPWFRPVRVINAPDNTVWLLDMQRRIIEHPEWIPEAWQQQFDLRAGSELGRIYRVRKSDFLPTSMPNLNDATIEQLLTALGSNNGAVRDLAQQVLASRESPELERSLTELVKSAKDPAVRLQALHCLAARVQDRASVWSLALDDPDWHVVRSAIEATDDTDSIETLNRFARRVLQAEDATDAVYLQLALSCGRNHVDSFSGVMNEIAKRKLTNNHVASALTLAHPAYADTILNGLFSRLSDHPIDENDARHLENCVRQLVQSLDEQTAAKYRRGMMPRMANSESTIPSFGDQLLLIGLASKAEGWEDDWQRSARSYVGRAMTDPEHPLSTRLRMIGLLGSRLFDEMQAMELLDKLLASGQPPEIRNAAIDTAFRLGADGVANKLITAWPGLFSDERSRVSATLMQRSTWLNTFMVALENNQIKPRDLDAATIQQLKTHEDAGIRDRATKLTGASQNVKRKEVADKYLKDFPQTADSERGGKMFKEHCATCHLGKDDSAALGAALTGLNHWTNVQWVNAVMDPNLAVEPRYLQYKVLTTEGQVFVGVIERRTANSVRIAAADGRRVEIENRDIETIRDSEVSMMPEGFEEKLQPQDLADIVAYLRQL
jgi:putative membrane-bound dehydrogenase-like protein